MTVSIVKTSGSAPIADGTSYTPSNTGTDQGVLSLQLYRDNSAGATSSDYQLNSVNFTQDQSILSQALISFTMYATAGYIPEANIPAAGTYDAKISSAATGNGGLVLTVDGLTQSGTVVKDLQLNTFQSSAMPSMTYSATAGDIVVVGYESNGGTLTAPAAASSGDSYVEQTNGALTGTPLSQGKIYTLLVTSDMTSESVGNWLSGSNSGSCLLAVFSGTSGGSTTTNKSTAYSASATPSLSNKLTLSNNGGYAASAAVALSKQVTLSQNKSYSASATAGIQKTINKDINYSASSQSSIKKDATKSMQYAASATASTQQSIVTKQNLLYVTTATLSTTASLIVNIGGKAKRMIKYIARSIVRSIKRALSR